MNLRWEIVKGGETRTLNVTCVKEIGRERKAGKRWKGRRRNQESHASGSGEKRCFEGDKVNSRSEINKEDDR